MRGVPLVGLETNPVTSDSTETLRHPVKSGAAKFGAVSPGTANALPVLEALASALLTLSLADRTRLAAMLLQDPGVRE
jgi:hypothetical protein